MAETLLRVLTDYVVVEIQGSPGPPSALAALGVALPVPRLRVSSSDGGFTAQIQDRDFDKEGGPGLYEEAVYWFVVESRIAGVLPQVSQRDPTVIERKNEIPSNGIVALTVVYRRQVGLSEWRFSVGEHELTIELEVFPAKLDYQLDYETLVADLTAAKRSLALEYFRGTHQRGSLDRYQVGQPLEWVLILRSAVDDLASAIQQVNRAPHRGLQYKRSLTAIHDVRGATPSTVRAIGRGEGVGPMVELGLVRAHARIPVDRSQETLDTFEHRWLRSRLRFVYRRLLALVSEQEARVKRARNRGGQAKRLTAELFELSEITTKVDQLISLPVIDSATAEVSPSFTSLQLQTATGYSEAHQVLTSLVSALAIIDGEQTYSLSDINELYEVWCFFKLATLVAESIGAEVDISEALTTTSSGLRFSLTKGTRSRIKLRTPSAHVDLIYNPEYSMPTGTQRPDIVIRSKVGRQVEQLIALDAKYRLDVSDGYVAQFGSPGAPTDAVNELHRYRDSIRPLINGKRAPVIIAGAALFPWPFELDSEHYGLRRSLDEVGIGALPFLPGNESSVVAWVTRMVLARSA